MHSYVEWPSLIQQIFLGRCGLLGTEAVAAADTMVKRMAACSPMELLVWTIMDGRPVN